MAKQKPEVTMTSYGIYTKWHAESKKLPRIVKFSHEIPAELDIEFGFIVNIKRAKNLKLYYSIEHPGIPDDSGEVMSPFDGHVFVKNNNWDFFLGDTIWAPVENKIGNWRLYLKLENKIIADKTFKLFDASLLSSGQTS